MIGKCNFIEYIFFFFPFFFFGKCKQSHQLHELSFCKTGISSLVASNKLKLVNGMRLKRADKNRIEYPVHTKSYYRGTCEILYAICIIFNFNRKKKKINGKLNIFYVAAIRRTASSIDAHFIHEHVQSVRFLFSFCHVHIQCVLLLTSSKLK